MARNKPVIPVQGPFTLKCTYVELIRDLNRPWSVRMIEYPFKVDIKGKNRVVNVFTIINFVVLCKALFAPNENTTIIK